MDLFRCPTCLSVLSDSEAERCPTCHQRLHRRRPIVLTGDRQVDGATKIRRHKGRRFGSKEAG